MSIAIKVKNALPDKAVRAIYDTLGAARGTILRGNAVHCVVCGGDFTKFLTFRGRANAQCPRCESLERHREAVQIWQEQTNLFTDQLRVLHVAPEVSLSRLLRRATNLDYVTGDITPGRADRVVDLTAINEPDGSFDVILCSHILEHIPDDAKAFAEIRRVLSATGWAFLAVPHDPTAEETFEDWSITGAKERQAAFGQWDHVRLYSRPGFEARVAAAGLSVERVSARGGDDVNGELMIVSRRVGL